MASWKRAVSVSGLTSEPPRFCLFKKSLSCHWHYQLLQCIASHHNSEHLVSTTFGTLQNLHHNHNIRIVRGFKYVQRIELNRNKFRPLCCKQISGEQRPFKVLCTRSQRGRTSYIFLLENLDRQKLLVQQIKRLSFFTLQPRD